MNISNVDIKVTREDLSSIINDIIDFAKLEDLEISSIDFKEGQLVLTGTYNFKIRIPFQLNLTFMYVKDNFLKLKISKFKVAKIGIASFIKKIALKKALSDFMVIGIISHDDEICIELDTIFTIVPYVTLELHDVSVHDDFITLAAENVQFSMNKNFIEFEEAMKTNEKIKSVQELNPKKEEKEIEINLDDENKVKDTYSCIRSGVAKNVCKDYSDILQCALILPDMIALIYRLIKDPRVDRKNKIILGVVTAYTVSPIDIIPDKIPFIGKIDELALVFFALDRLVNTVPEAVILQNWQGKENIILTIKEGISFIKPFVGADNIDKISGYINMASKNI